MHAEAFEKAEASAHIGVITRMIDCKYRIFKFKNCAGDKIKKEVSAFF